MTNNHIILDQIEIDLRSDRNDLKTIYIDIYDNSLSRKWLSSLNHLLENNYHLEKNYCFFGFVSHARNGNFILDQINKSISAINKSGIGYHIDDYFSMENCLGDGCIIDRTTLKKMPMARSIIHDKFNNLHRYFEDLQGVSGAMSPYFQKATPDIRWHIRQLNLLCHEFESWALSYRKELEAPEWQRPSQIMCWLNSPRFTLDEEDYELFGVETISRGCGDVYVGVNKAIGKHHWEVFNDEGRDVSELTTSTLRSQTEAAGDFDIEWGKNPSGLGFQTLRLNDFKKWLTNNGFDPEDKSLTIGHPKIGNVDLSRSFDTINEQEIWKQLSEYLDVYSIRTSTANAVYDYKWNDDNYMSTQVEILSEGKNK